eukprot:3830635-Pleurochrysis_carterae.AAC.2
MARRLREEGYKAILLARFLSTGAASGNVSAAKGKSVARSGCGAFAGACDSGEKSSGFACTSICLTWTTPASMICWTAEVDLNVTKQREPSRPNSCARQTTWTAQGTPPASRLPACSTCWHLLFVIRILNREK